MTDMHTPEFSRNIMYAMEAIAPNLYYVILVVTPEGEAIQIGNVDPESQRFYFEQALEGMRDATVEFIEEPKHQEQP